MQWRLQNERQISSLIVVPHSARCPPHSSVLQGGGAGTTPAEPDADLAQKELVRVIETLQQLVSRERSLDGVRRNGR